MVRTTIPQEHLALIERIARRLIRRLPSHIMTLDDLVSVGYIGYREACARYDAERSVRFAAFAGYRIRGAMLDALRQRDPLSRDHRFVKNRRGDADALLTTRLGRPPTREEVAAYLGVTENAIEAIDRIPSSPELLVDPADANGVLAEIPDEGMSGQSAFDYCVVREALARIEPAFALLNARERYVLHERYVRGSGQREVAETLGVTISRVSQIESAIIAKLRAAYEAPVLAVAA